jgi:Domain of unknown function (DUF4258)
MANLAYYRFTLHAREQMATRDISEADVARVISSGSIYRVDPVKRTTTFQLGAGKWCLRVAVDTSTKRIVVTAFYDNLGGKRPS